MSFIFTIYIHYIYNMYNSLITFEMKMYFKISFIFTNVYNNFAWLDTVLISLTEKPADR